MRLVLRKVKKEETPGELSEIYSLQTGHPGMFSIFDRKIVLLFSNILRSLVQFIVFYFAWLYMGRDGVLSHIYCIGLIY